MLERERELIVAFARRLERDDLAMGTSGNLSARDGEHVAITPSAIDYERLTPKLVCVVGLDGATAEIGPKPSTELPMHLALYAKTDATAIVHTHSPYATTLSTLLDELPSIHYLIAFLGGPVRVAPFATPGSAELGETAAEALDGRSAVILANHGAITIGPSLEAAYERARMLEWLCALHYRALLAGDPRILSDDEMRAVGEALSDYWTLDTDDT